MTDNDNVQPLTPIPVAEKAVSSFGPTNLAEAIEFSKLLAASAMVPKDYQGKHENVLVALQMGSEVGLPPMAALQNIAVINGRPSVWGDGALAIVMTHPRFKDIEETIQGEGDERTATCVLHRKGMSSVARTFSVADAKTAKLWGSNVWEKYPDRMLAMRARGFTIRDGFPDALRGMQLAEEIRDLDPQEKEIPANRVEVTASESTPSTADEDLAAKLEESEPEEEPSTQLFQTVEKAIEAIQSPDDANNVLKILHDTSGQLSDDEYNELRGRVTRKMNQEPTA